MQWQVILMALAGLWLGGCAALIHELSWLQLTILSAIPGEEREFAVWQRTRSGKRTRLVAVGATPAAVTLDLSMSGFLVYDRSAYDPASRRAHWVSVRSSYNFFNYFTGTGLYLSPAEVVLGSPAAGEYPAQRLPPTRPPRPAPATVPIPPVRPAEPQREPPSSPGGENPDGGTTIVCQPGAVCVGGSLGSVTGSGVGEANVNN